MWRTPRLPDGEQYGHQDASPTDASTAASRPPQSPFLTKLPSELRHLIYHELWQSAYGSTRQHIIWHGSDPDSRHFCRWTCCLPAWDRADGLQERIQRLQDQGLELDKQEARRLQSPWLNHWMCGEDVRAKMNAADAVCGKVSTAFGPCWRQDAPASPSQQNGAFMSMLLVCRTISSECLDWFCHFPPGWQQNPAPATPAFFRLARKVEICLPANFAARIPCSDPDNQNPPLHDGLDFHWLRLDRFKNLTSLKIWIASRDAPYFSNPDLPPAPRASILADLEAESLKAALQNLSSVQSVEISAALHQDINTATGEEDGFVHQIDAPNVQIWKRGTGDYYHPCIGPVNQGGPNDGILIGSKTRYVREHIQARSIEHVNLRPFPPTNSATGSRRLFRFYPHRVARVRQLFKLRD